MTLNRGIQDKETQRGSGVDCPQLVTAWGRAKVHPIVFKAHSSNASLMVHLSWSQDNRDKAISSCATQRKQQRCVEEKIALGGEESVCWVLSVTEEGCAHLEDAFFASLFQFSKIN